MNDEKFTAVMGVLVEQVVYLITENYAYDELTASNESKAPDRKAACGAFQPLQGMGVYLFVLRSPAHNWNKLYYRGYRFIYRSPQTVNGVTYRSVYKL